MMEQELQLLALHVPLILCKLEILVWPVQLISKTVQLATLIIILVMYVLLASIENQMVSHVLHALMSSRAALNVMQLMILVVV